jgi:hypothetical protein
MDLDGFSLLFLPSSDPGSDPDPALIIWMAEELSKIPPNGKFKSW